MACDDYEAPDLGSLRSPAHDVDALATALAAPRIGAFDVERVFNRPAHEVNAAIEDFFCDKKPDDLLLLYVSCHGVKDDAGNLYFATTNTRVKRLGSSGIASTFVRDQMSYSRSRNIILLLDCCYSGAFVEGMVRRGGGNVGVTERLSGSGRAILSSSSALEYAFELDDRHVTRDISLADAGQKHAGRPSIFTGALVEGLTTGEADQNRDGLISVDELYDYTYSKVTEANPHQTPTKFSDVSGELIVAYSPGTVRPPSLPDEVASAARNPLSSVRAAAVETLKSLALAGDPTGRLAYEQLKALLDDDSRTVMAKAEEAIKEINRTATCKPPPPKPTPLPKTTAPPGHHPHPTTPPTLETPPPSTPPTPGPPPTPPGPPPTPGTPPMPGVAPTPGMPSASGVERAAGAGGYWVAPGAAVRSYSLPAETPASSVGPLLPPWGSLTPVPVTGPAYWDEPLRVRSVLAYFLPFFMSLVLLLGRSRNVRYHALQCALIDAVTTVYFVVAAIPAGIYSSARYGSEEVPAGDVVFNVYVGVLFVLPLGLRGYCLVQLARKGTARIKFLGTLAHRIVYRAPHGRVGAR